MVAIQRSTLLVWLKTNLQYTLCINNKWTAILNVYVLCVSAKCARRNIVWGMYRCTTDITNFTYKHRVGMMITPLMMLRMITAFHLDIGC